MEERPQFGGHIYLDANACYGLTEEIYSELKGLDYNILNPSSVHQCGQMSKAILEDARTSVRNCLSAKDYRIVFNSGATEANNHCIHSVLEEKIAGDARCHVISAANEHPAVLAPLDFYHSRGCDLTLLKPASDGCIHAEQVLEAVKEETRFVSIMMANNETGNINEVSEIVAKLKAVRPDILIHSDAVQALGKHSFNLEAIPVDFLSLSGHKIGAPAGVGALLFREELKPMPFLRGGSQELRHRPGTENILGIHLFGRAAMQNKRERLRRALDQSGLEIRYNTNFDCSLPNTINLTLPGLPADDFVVALDLEGIAISSGSACSSGKPLPSHVLQAQGLSNAEAKSSLRLSFRHDLPDDHLDRAAEKFIACSKRILQHAKAA